MARTPDLSRVLTPDEIEVVVADLHRRRRSVNTRQNRVIFRLAVGCGLRVSEIADLRLGDVKTEQTDPVVLVRSGKGGEARTVPVIDEGTLGDLQAWRAERIEQGAEPPDPFVATLSKNSWGNRLHRTSIRARFRNACKALGPERLERLTTHDARQTFLTNAVERKVLGWARAADTKAEPTEIAALREEIEANLEASERRLENAGAKAEAPEIARVREEIRAKMEASQRLLLFLEAKLAEAP